MDKLIDLNNHTSTQKAPAPMKQIQQRSSRRDPAFKSVKPRFKTLSKSDIIGFASAGQAIAHQKQMGLSNAYIPGMIRVSVDVPVSKGEFNTFVATCNSETAISLADGRIDSSEFMQEIMKTMEIL